MKTRPVRLPPWAAGASPTSTTRAFPSPKPGTGRPQYSSSANAGRRSFATCSRHATKRGQRRHRVISSVSSASLSRRARDGPARLGGDTAMSVRWPEVAPPRSPVPALALLVRHGTTSTTGKVLPGRAPGLHLSDARTKAGGGDGRAPGRPGAKAGCRVRLASGAGGGDGPAHRLRPRLPGPHRPGPARVRLRRVDRGQALEPAPQTPEWRTVQVQPSSTFRFPGGESFAEMQARIVDTARPTGEVPSWADLRGGVPRRSDQGRRRRRRRRPLGPLPATRGLAVLRSRPSCGARAPCTCCA